MSISPIPLEKMGQIYKIICKVNNKNYIGQTQAFTVSVNYKWIKRGYKYRFKEHIYEAATSKTHNVKLNNAIRKYGKEQFEPKLIFSCHPGELDYYECKFIKKYDSINNGYNITEGGNALESTPEIVEKRARRLTVINSTKRKIYIKENTKRIEKAILLLINNNSSEYVCLDIYLDNPSEFKRFRYYQSYESIEEPFDRAFDDIIMSIDGQNLFVQHELQNCIPLDRLELYEFNRDDIERIKDTLGYTRGLFTSLEKRFEKFRGIKFNKISIRLKTDRGSYLVDVIFITDKTYAKIATQFGGRKVSFLFSYEKALEFARMCTSDDNIEIRGDIQNIIRLIKC